MTDYSNVQKVIKNWAAVFPFFSVSPCWEYFCLRVWAGESAHEGDVSFPSFKLMIIMRLTCHIVNISEILFSLVLRWTPLSDRVCRPVNVPRVAWVHNSYPVTVWQYDFNIPVSLKAQTLIQNPCCLTEYNIDIKYRWMMHCHCALLMQNNDVQFLLSFH